jgi:ABC-type multidrug transport system fused ATPase/permease subunit
VGNPKMKITSSVVKDVSNLSNVLTKLDRKKLAIVSILNIGLSALDLIGVTLIGLVGALTINGVRSQTPNGKVGEVLNYLHLSDIAFQSQVVILSLIAVLLLVTRTLLSIVITRKTLFFLSRRSAEIASRLISRVMSQPLSTLKQFGSQHIHYTLTTGTNSLALGVFGNVVSVISDLSLIIVLGVGITLIDPLTAAFTILIFGSLMVFMYYLTNRKTQVISRKHSELSIRDSETLLELIAGYREAFIRNRLGYFVDNAKDKSFNINYFNTSLKLKKEFANVLNTKLFNDVVLL